jgi:hypothetical protein
LVATVVRGGFRDLSACVGAPGPHDFAVRCSIIRPRKKLRLTLPRPSHPAPNVRDDREAPLLWERDKRKEAIDLGSAQSGIFLQTGLDDPNQLESLDEIAFYAPVIFSRPSRADGAASADIDLICPVRPTSR